MHVRLDNRLTLLEMAALAVSLLLVVCYTAAAGHFTRHMLLHIGLMTVLAPLLASWMNRLQWRFPGAGLPGFLPAVTVLQLLLFFARHAPQALTWMMVSPIAHGVMQAVLLLVATAFWASVLQRSAADVWPPVVALLLTGKLFCLVAVILVFAPRVLYLSAGAHVHAAIALEDQQLAGLLMIVACPMTYILAAVVLVARWLRPLADETLERRV